MNPDGLECPIFARRRLEEPQAVIDALIAQTARQGARIKELTDALANEREAAKGLAEQFAEAEGGDVLARRMKRER